MKSKRNIDIFCMEKCKVAFGFKYIKSQDEVRPPDKSLYLKIIFLISQPKHML